MGRLLNYFATKGWVQNLLLRLPNPAALSAPICNVADYNYVVVTNRALPEVKAVECNGVRVVPVVGAVRYFRNSIG